MGFQDFLAEVESVSEGEKKGELITSYLSTRTVPVVEGDRIHFLYRGAGNEVAVPSELNKWDPTHCRMERAAGTDLFYRSEQLSPAGRLEYKIWVDGGWRLDPLNKRVAPGGYGENSDVWMGAYRPPPEINFDPAIPHGRIDNHVLESRILGRAHPLYVYVPPAAGPSSLLGSLYVLDGQDYLRFGMAGNILDNLIAKRKIAPTIAVFLEPRTDPNNPGTNHRMTDYAANDTYCRFLGEELLPFIATNYPVDTRLPRRMIMGESMGGLMATYIVLKHTDLFLSCAAQSPAFMQADCAVIKLLKQMTKANVRVYLETGTINDTHIEAALVSGLLREKGASVQFSKYPEGHNWSNWRARIGDILEYFFA